MAKRYNDAILRRAKARHILRNLGKAGIILLAILIGCVCIIISTFSCLSTPWEQNDNWRIIINNILATVTTVSFAGVAWEAIAKYTFSRDVVDMAGLSENIKESGTITIEKEWKDIPWSTLLDGKRHIVAVFSYSTKWGQNHSNQLKNIAKKASGKGDSEYGFTVVLPDPSNTQLISSLAYRFEGVSEAEVVKKIKAAAVFYHDLGAEIEYHSKAITDSFYILGDDTAIMAPFTHGKASGGHTQTSVPALITKSPGFMYSYIIDEVKAIRETASPAIIPEKKVSLENNQPASPPAKGEIIHHQKESQDASGHSDSGDKPE